MGNQQNIQWHWVLQRIENKLHDSGQLRALFWIMEGGAVWDLSSDLLDKRRWGCVCKEESSDKSPKVEWIGHLWEPTRMVSVTGTWWLKREEGGVKVRHVVGNQITRGLWGHCRKLRFWSKRARKLLASFLLGNTMIWSDIWKRFLCRLDGGWTHGLHGTRWEKGRTISVRSEGGRQHWGSRGWLMNTCSSLCHSFDLHWLECSSLKEGPVSGAGVGQKVTLILKRE